MVISFFLEPKHFNSFNEFNDFVRAIQEGKKVNFDGNKKIFSVDAPQDSEIYSENEISSKKLTYGYLRQIIRVGYIEKDGQKLPYPFLEREYLQNHPQIKAMRENHLKLLKNLKADFGNLDYGEADQFCVEGTRNEKEGVWVDYMHSRQRSGWCASIKP